MRPLRPCNQPGCAQLVRPPESYCPTHKWTEEQRRAYHRERHKRYDETKRDRRAKRFYDSAAWRRLRQAVLVRDNHLCVMCLERHRVTAAEHVDHIVPIAEDWDRRLDPDNCRSLCHSCHSRRHAAERPPGVEKFPV